MPCDSRRLPQQNAEDRKREILDTIARLEAGLTSGQARVVLSPSGAVAFAGEAWTGQTNRVTDACAFRKLQLAGSPALRLALARAEALTGRRASLVAVASGEHSHDGGITWGRH